MAKIIAFAGTTSKSSINKQLVEHAVTSLHNTNYEVLDLNDFPLPIFSVDEEKENGFPDNGLKFSSLIEESNGIILSLAEHNGSYTAVFKNLFDWLSRIEPKLWRNKPMLLLSSSPGGRGGKGVLNTALERFPRHDSNIIASFSLPYFNDNFSDNSISNPSLESDFLKAVTSFEASLIP